MTIEPVAGVDVDRLAAEFMALRAQIAPNASPEELRVFARVCRQLDLSPWAGQICLIGRWNRAAGREVHRHQITVDGRRAIADRTGRLEGIEGPYWSGPRDESGALDWQDLWTGADDDDHPYAARCFVHVAGWKSPANGTAKWSEFAQTDSRGQLTPTWTSMPAHMLGKVAESMALRRGFPEVAAAVDLSVDQLEPDDAAIVAEAATSSAAQAPADVAAGEADPGPARTTAQRARARAANLDDDQPTEGQARLIANLLAKLELTAAAVLGDLGLEPPLTAAEGRRLLDHLKALDREASMRETTP